MNTLRVGIPVIGGSGWIGGVSHIELHVKAVTCLPKAKRPQLFLIVNSKGLDQLEYYRPFFERFDGIIYWGIKIGTCKEQFGGDVIYCGTEEELFTIIDFYFPVNFNVIKGRCAASWIHDFQHRYFPELFSKQDIELREELCRRIAQYSKLLFCSSKAVESDFRRFFPTSAAYTRVIPLRVFPEESWYVGDSEEVQKKYGLPEHFIICCNQFWMHKNHLLLLKAIAILRGAGHEVHLACTGETCDFRRPEYFQEVKARIVEWKIEELVHILGIIPRQDQIQLLRRSHFVVQPSLFEGLSLIVQESRALGKAILLSDIDVHLEHQYGVFFQRHNAADLAKRIQELFAITGCGPDWNREAEARLRAQELAKVYALQFRQLTEEACDIFAGKEVQMKSNCKIPIATSIDPDGDLPNQIKAVESWLVLGFAVYSVNYEQDAERLQAMFPDVEFCIIGQDTAQQGKVLLHNVIACLQHNDSSVCGVAWSENYLFGANLSACVLAEAKGAVVYTVSEELETIESSRKGIFGKIGFIFFDRNFLRLFPEEPVKMGLPWWDLWMLLVLLSHKHSLKKITGPVSFHTCSKDSRELRDGAGQEEVIQQYLPKLTKISEENAGKYHQALLYVLGQHSQSINA
jgi:glycosyltransferase involved in cell wall biosynthesis